MKRIIAIVLTAAMLFAASGSVYAQSEYYRTGFTDSEMSDLAKDAVIIRVDNDEYYADNLRECFFTYNSSITPYIDQNRIYTPVLPVVKSLGFDAEKSDDSSIRVKAGDKEYLFSAENGDVTCLLRYGELFAAAEDIASCVGVEYIENGDIGYFFKDKDKVDSITDNVLKKFRQSLEYEWGNVLLGSLGFVTGMIVHPLDENLMYVRTDVGGLYRFDAVNESWIPLLDTLPYEDKHMQGVRSIAIDPNDVNILYAACGSYNYSSPSDILKSTDQGKNWRRLNFNQKFGANDGRSRLSGECLVVDPNNSDRVYCGTLLNGLWVSEDAGESWSKIESVPNGPANPRGGVSMVYIDDRDVTQDGCSSTVYAGVFGVGVFLSTNGGKSFNLMPDTPKLPNRMQESQGKIYLSAADDSSVKISGGFFCYENGVWRDITPTEKGKYGMNAFLIDRTNPNIILANTAPNTPYLYRSYDAGETWEYMGAFRNASCLIQDPRNPSGAFMPHGAGIYYIPDIYADSYTIQNADKNIEELVSIKAMSLPSDKAPKVITQVIHLLWW